MLMARLVQHIQSGRIEARTGLRMMPTFPRSSLSFRTAGFPQINSAVAVIGIDIGKNSFHVIGQDKRGAIMLRQKWSRGQAEARLANPPPCLIGMEACVGGAPSQP